ncbi:MAG: DUF6308 family protein [Candidatus Eisenbacteria bacterium]
MLEIKLSNGWEIGDPEARIRDYCNVEVYSGYDDRHDISDTITRDTIIAANRIFARISGATGQRMMLSESIRERLRSIQNKDLGEIPDDEWTSRRGNLRALLSDACSLDGVRIAVATKVLHLKRPKLIPILDAFVVRFLVGIDTANVAQKERLIDIACDAIDMIRADLATNRAAFSALQRSLSDLPILFENVRLYDILIWSTEKWDVREDPRAIYGTPETAGKRRPRPSTPTTRRASDNGDLTDAP